MSSGVSPCAIFQRISPRLMSIAVIEPYGGFSSGNPSTLSATFGSPRVGSAGFAGFAAAIGNSERPPPAAEPEPPDVRGPVTALPSTYAMSDCPGSGATRPLLTTDPCDATYRMPVSGSNEPPGQLVPPSWLGAISVPR